MNRREFLAATSQTIALIALSKAISVKARQPSTLGLGPLRVNAKNPRYFTNDSGKAIYLTGSGTWNNLQDMGPTDPPPAFDFDEYLDLQDKHYHSFIRLWHFDLLIYNTIPNHVKNAGMNYVSPHPWARTGPGAALDGKPKFNLEQFNESYFKRLRSRVEAAGKRGMYVSVMLFEGWGLQFMPDGWKEHPFNPANNINGIGTKANSDGRELEIYELAFPSITRAQESYVRKVVDTVNDCDNVLFEISNENHPRSTKWQYYFIRFIHDYEKSKPRQHPVGMTFQYKGGSNVTLFDGPADWISPGPNAGNFNYCDNPPPSNGRKVILSDTDHLWGFGGSPLWVWKSFLRGLNPLFMDPYKRKVLDVGSDAQWEPIRRALGDARRFAEKVNLTAMTPQGELASTGYCLANAGSEYLICQPKSNESFSSSLVSGCYDYEWFDLVKGATAGRGQIESLGGKHTFAAPFDGESILYLKAKK